MPVSLQDTAGRSSPRLSHQEIYVNVLNQLSAAKPSTEPFAVAATLDPTTLIPKGSVFTVIGQVRNWRLGFAGRIQCTLRLSFGDLQVSANRETLSIDTIAEGDWVRARLMHRHDGTMQVIGAIAVAPPDGDTSWVPAALYHRNAAMHELRRLLGTLEPALQAVFMAVMLDMQVQRRFFWRPAAADHHCYPGGLFDQSVAAANLASRSEYDNDRERGLATLASLLFDIGKATDLRLQADRPRCWPELHPHAATAARLSRTLRRLAQSQPFLAADLAELIAGDLTDPGLLFTPGVVLLRNRVRRAVQQSWGPAESFLQSLTNPGAAA
jgi:hypothetical protein